ncbi:hypothetical protein ACJBU6_07106 [Exserohilum turcicum]
METCSNHTSASMAIVAAKEHLAHRSTTSDTTLTTFDAKDREIVRLQRALTELKAAHRASEAQLRVSKEELFNVRETLNGTLAEYANLREELKVLKQNLGRDHQAIVYRKDIELFALRKGNEQKDQCIRDRDVKIEEMSRQHKAAIEVKDAQLRLMKERIISIERESSPRFTEEGEDGDHALEVRLLRVRKSSRASQHGEEDKDAIIARLREQLSAIPSVSDDIVNHQAELSRAWDVVEETKKALKKEREKRIQTQEQRDEAMVKLCEIEAQSGSRASTVAGRLPTINENDHDKNELEAIFDTTQEENIRLYAEVAALEKRLTDANSRTFAAVQECEALRSQLKMTKPNGGDVNTARPSVVHHVHLQRMEDQLVDLRDALKDKEDETRKLKKSLANKDLYVKEIQGELDAAATFHTQDQDEIERLKQSISELQATKYQLMLDRERLVTNRPRHRVISTERTDRTSARSSGATLIQELSAASNTPSENNAPPTTAQSVTVPEREGSIQQTPVRHLRSKSSHKAELNRWSLMSQNLPPPELREYKETRRKSSGFKEVMQKMVGGNKKEESIIRRALTPKDKNARTRPSTAASNVAVKPVRQTSANKVATSPVPQNVRAPKAMRKRPTNQRYYAEQEASDQENQVPERPHTMGANVPEKPKSRLHWGATNKLKRRSLL